MTALPWKFARECAFAAVAIAGLARGAGAAESLKPAELFQPTKIWSAHFTLAPDQWELLQPRQISPAEATKLRNGLAASNGWVLTEVHADLDFEGIVLRNIALRAKGNGTLINAIGTLKMPLKADLNQFVKGQKLGGLSTLDFHNNIWDPASTNEMLAYRLFRDIGIAAPRVTYARVFLTVPGKYDRKYVGLYSVVENVDRNFLEDRFGSREGALFKPVGNMYAYRSANWADYEKDWDPKTDLTDAQKQRVIAFTDFASNAAETEFAGKIGSFVDIDSAARYFAGVVWVSNLDGPPAGTQNLYFYLDPKTDKFVYLPWDQDDAWGGFGASQDIRNTLSILHPWNSTSTFITRLFQLEAFQKPYLAALARIALGSGRSEVLARQQDELAAALRPAVREESESALALFEIATSEGMVARTFSGVFGAHGPHSTLKTFAKAREKSVIDQLLGLGDAQ